MGLIVIFLPLLLGFVNMWESGRGEKVDGNGRHGSGLAVRLIADLDLIFCGYPLEWCSLKSGKLF